MKTKLLNYSSSRSLLFNDWLVEGYDMIPRPKSLNFQKKFSNEEKKKIVLEGQSGKSTISEICRREKITPEIFENWSSLYLKYGFEDKTLISDKFISDDEKFKIVLEGLNGEFSVAEICRREEIDQDTFLDWSQTFLNVKQRYISDTPQDLNVEKRRSEIIQYAGIRALNYFNCHMNTFSSNSVVLTSSDIEALKNYEKPIKNLICLYKMNDLRYINKHYEEMNIHMDIGDRLIGCLETFSARKERIWVNNLPVLNQLYFSAEFFIKRILPKLSFTKKMYFEVSKGKDRLLSKAEGLGRLVSCGFKIIDYKSINGLVYFVVQKEREPVYDMSPSYGPLYAMPRLGKHGKIIKVFKLRTMHPYSEYLQDYVLKANGYAKTGKPADDFRIPAWGKLMRRFWLDEIPQLINFAKGELKLVGIRPVSERYFQDIPKEMQKLRLTQKPGCIPPYVSLNRSGDVMSVLQAEKEYLEEKIRYPYTTDTKYFFKAIFNIIFKQKRSA